ncbi:hypothetical protein, partial [Variovorax sp. Varisp62]|uniref:hypothetical protein n=1 Tax=Variovorax sp. Varisp62 TaxID=3243049 RepID=UPI0039B3BA47
AMSCPCAHSQRRYRLLFLHAGGLNVREALFARTDGSSHVKKVIDFGNAWSNAVPIADLVNSIIRPIAA